MTTLLADVASGKTGMADTFFLIGVILFAIAFVAELVALSKPVADPWWRLFVAAGLACVALGWLVL